MKLKTYPMLSSLEAFRPDGHGELLRIARNNYSVGEHNGLNPASREDTSGGPLRLPVVVVPPQVLYELAPWLADWYRGPLLEKARDFAGPTVVASDNPDNFPLINIHRGLNHSLGEGESYESHVDTNFPTGLYYLGESDRSTVTGGPLVVSTRGDVPTRAEVLKACKRYYPKVGEFAVMNGYGVTHFVEPSIDGQDRIMLVCNFWTPDVPESARGVGLVDYQQGEMH